MEEAIFEKLLEVSKGLHWLGKYSEANTCTLLSRILRKRGIDDLEKLGQWVAEEGA